MGGLLSFGKGSSEFQLLWSEALPVMPFKWKRPPWNAKKARIIAASTLQQSPGVSPQDALFDELSSPLSTVCGFFIDQLYAKRAHENIGVMLGVTARNKDSQTLPQRRWFEVDSLGKATSGNTPCVFVTLWWTTWESLGQKCLFLTTVGRKAALLARLLLRIGSLKADSSICAWCWMLQYKWYQLQTAGITKRTNQVCTAFWHFTFVPVSYLPSNP